MRTRVPTTVMLVLLLLLGLHLRVGAVLKTEIDTPVRADARLYYLYGLNLKHSGTFSHSYPDMDHPVPDAFAPPVFPLAITPFIELPPTDRMVVNIGLAQAILGTLTIFFTFILIRSIAGDVAGLLATALTAISPHLISLTTYMLTESLFTFFMMGGLMLTAFAVSKDKVWFAVAGGLLLGLSALTRSTLEYFPLFLLLALPIFSRIDRLQRKNIVACAMAAIAIVLVWKIRNLLVLGMLSDPKLMISSIQTGIYPNLTFEGHPESLGIPYRFDPRNSEIGASLSNVLHEIITRFETAPWRHLQWYLFGKPVFLLSWNMISGWGDIFVYPVVKSPYFSLPLYQGTRTVMLLLHPALMIIGFICSLVAITRSSWLGIERSSRVTLCLLGVLVVYFILLHMVGAPYPRYGVPLRPVMYGMAMVLLVICIRQGAKLIRARTGPANG